MKSFTNARLMIGLVTVWIGSASAGATYDQLYPQYVQLCAVSQIRPVNLPAGGAPGHAVMYVKGACRDTSRGYPRLKLCDPATTDFTDPESGVGISVDRMFSNVNWMAVDGKEMLISGQVDRSQPLTASVQDELLQRTIGLGLYDGITLHEKYVEESKRHKSFLDYLAVQSVGTNFAVSLGRNVYCAKMPIKPKQLELVIENLNELNDRYRNRPYRWSAIYDNCTHTIRNALAAAGVWGDKDTRQFLPVQLLNMSVPANEYLGLLRRGNDSSIKNVVRLYRDRLKRRMLLEHGWLVTQHGVMTDNHGIHSVQNELYDTERSGMLALDLPGLNPNKKKFNRTLTEERYSDLRANLLYFKEKYTEALAAKRSLVDLKRRHSEMYEELSSAEFVKFYHAYYRHLEAALADVEQKLGAL